MSDERREYFRVRYPEVERPIIEIDDNRYDVAELSEGGLRVLGDFGELESAQPVKARLHLLSGEPVKIMATFSRIDEGEAVFDQLAGISFAEMMNEQRYLIRKYPSVKDE
ncbi:MAG: PilZ domain-containing protein [Planctomycetota bacterium]|jgi:hypothetical protein